MGVHNKADSADEKTEDNWNQGAIFSYMKNGAESNVD